jgi:hypothetical protein
MQNFINWSKMQGYEIVIGSDKMPIYQKNNEDFSPEEVVNEFNNINIESRKHEKNSIRSNRNS